MTDGAKAILRFCYVLTSLQGWLSIYFPEPKILFPLPLKADNQGGLKYAINKSGTASRLKHLDIRECFIRDIASRNIVRPLYFPSASNKANGLTKIVLGKDFFNFLEMNGVRNIEPGIKNG
ncbi:unnamed protein product [Amoebophrya sp. A25]|nr:unnamed protein product [Amoebophrya sp. A25]|eukprot:GSA25T00022381001.1